MRVCVCAFSGGAGGERAGRRYTVRRNRPHTGKMAHLSALAYTILIAHAVRRSIALSVAELVCISLGVIEHH